MFQRRSSARRGSSKEEDGAVDHRTLVGIQRRAETRSRIVEAALQVYSRMGADAPVIDDFVKAAGVSRGTFYNHFTTTAELLEATIDFFAEALAQAIVDAIDPAADVVASAATAMRLHLHWVTADPKVCAFFAKVPRVGEIGRRHAQAQYRRGVASGAFLPMADHAASDLMFGTVNETVRRVARSPDEPKCLDQVVVAVLTGLGVAAPKIQKVMAQPLPPLDRPVRAVAAGEREDS